MKINKTSQFSRLFGAFANCEFPMILQTIINKAYVSLMKVDMSEFDKPSTYKSLNKLFTRELKKQRSFEKDEFTCISPCDAYVSEAGIIKNSTALQIKGFEYSVNNLLGDYILKQNKEKLEEGAFINFYLSPRDYHRYHVPMDMRIKKAVHIPGKLYPVNFKWLKKVPALFCENERVVLECETINGNLFYLVFVGALNVGKMAFTFDERIQTNVKKEGETLYMYKDKSLKKGDELGRFEMGSTIVAFFEKETFKLTKKANESVRFGQTIGIFTCKS